MRVLVIEDLEPLRQTICLFLLLDDRIELVGDAADGAQGISLAAAYQPDVVVLDATMPVMDGIEALPHIHAAAPRTRVVVFTTLFGPEAVQRWLDAGAAATVDKSESLETLVQTILRIGGAG